MSLLSGRGRRDPDYFRAPGRPAGGRRVPEQVDTMRESYDFSKAKRNPYARRLKQQVTIRLDHDTVKYFKRLAEETGIAYQTLINLYLRECVLTGKKLSNTWTPAQAKQPKAASSVARRSPANH